MSPQSITYVYGTRGHRACFNCRRKKVRCYGEKPVCRFCARLGQQCQYPDSQTSASLSVALDRAGLGREQEYEFLLARLSALEERLSLATAHPDPSPPPMQIESNYLSRTSSLENNPQAYQPAASQVAPSAFIPNSTSTLLDPETMIDNYFRFFHNQPYSFFDEGHFRQQFRAGLLPSAVQYALFAIAFRFSQNSLIHDNPGQAQCYADMGWSAAMAQCFGNDEGPDYRMVQALTLLAIYDFIECKHRGAWIKIGLAGTIAQALHMMADPDPTLPWVVQEERRRTFWSIYLLDKMATCGRGRPPIFQDHTCLLQLPGKEFSSSIGNSKQAPTLHEFVSTPDCDLGELEPLAKITVLVATVSQVATYAFQLRSSIDTKPPWDHGSDYSILASKLHGFGAYFETWKPISSTIPTHFRRGNDIDYSASEPFLFSYVVFHLCHCLLQHPFLIRRHIRASSPRFSSFFSATTKSGFEHARELTHTLAFARQSGHKAAASFYGYSSLVAASINALFQYSDDEAIRQQSHSALSANVAFLAQHACYWPNAAKMVVTLDKFILKAQEYRSLIDVTCESVELSQPDVDYLYSVVDYGSLSTAAANDKLCQNKAGVLATTQDDQVGSTCQSTNIDRSDTLNYLYGAPTLASDMSSYLPDFDSNFDFNFQNAHPQQDPDFYAQFFTDMGLST